MIVLVVIGNPIPLCLFPISFARPTLPLPSYWVAVRATGYKTPGESSVILQSAVRIQLTSRRILRD